MRGMKIFFWLLAGLSSAQSVSLGAEFKDENSKKMFEKWAAIHTVFKGEPSSIGFYSAGCLKGAIEMPMDGIGFHMMKPSRLRYYGHPEMKEFVSDLGKKVFESKLEALLVGDIGRPRGGPTISGHASHQTGLDVDIWFTRRKKISMKEREHLSAGKFVQNNTAKHWTTKETKILELAANHPLVDRIFVHPAIKIKLCQSSEEFKSWLGKIRPWWGHDDHFHVRLKCPGNASCKGQEPLSAGIGCGKELEWWFSAEAKAELEKNKAKIGREFPMLPQECQGIVAN